ncbi:MAG TPA: ABC transporter ATP-binding protein [Xanthobacteraceae bacterium]|jgi:iron(III) transport system ATP-binding protein
MTFLILQSVRKRYGHITALDGVDLEVTAGSRTAIVGPSGCGKTTLLRVTAGFELPDTGCLMLDGAVLTDARTAVPAHQRGIGFVAQDGGLFPHLNIADNVGFGIHRQEPGRTKRIAELMAMVELPLVLLRRKPHELSGGQQQRVALARALARRPRLMLLDEPFSALDTELRTATRKAVANLLDAAGMTTILVTHDHAEALSFADQVAVMREGAFLQVGSPHELYLRPRTATIATSLGEAIVLPAELSHGWAECELGRIAVDEPNRFGKAQIMLRPEQISLKPTSGGEPSSESGTAFCRVAEIDFAGAVYTIALQLLTDGAGPRVRDVPQAMGRLLLRQSSPLMPSEGTTVQILVAGKAHVLAS